jgi:archaeosine-15-forming tRNA-guanine transglycosylase
VLVWCPEQEPRGVVVGRIGRSARRGDDVPAELVIEARERLILQCADGSITMRGDGKILIKGTDLVSRAQRTNRIKGGAVSIN